MRARRPQSRLGDHLETLHADVIAAVQARDLTTFRRAVETYQDIILTFPQEWARHGQDFVSGLAGDIDDFRPSYLDKIMSSLYDELREIVRIGSAEFLREALGLSFRVLAESVGLRAHALWVSMLRHLRYAYRLASGAPDDDLADLGKDLSVRYQFEIGRYYVGSLIEDTNAKIDDRRNAVQFMEEWFDELAELSKFLVEEAQAVELGSLNDQWEQVLEYWQPEFESPSEFEVERLAMDVGADDERVRQAQEVLSRNQELARLKSHLLAKRQGYRVALLWWASRLWTGDEGPHRDVFDRLLGAFSSLPALIEATNSALDLDAEGTPPWHRWELATLPEGRAHTLASDLALLGVSLLAAMLRPDEPVGEAVFAPLGDRIQSAQEMLPHLVDDPRVLARMDSETAQARARAIEHGLQGAASAHASEAAAALRAAPLSDEKIATFRREVLKSWEESRVVGVIFEKFDRLLLDPDQSVLDESEGWFGRDELMHKHLFSDIRDVGGLESFAQHLGQGVTLGEVIRLVRHLADTRQSEIADADINAAVEATKADMAVEGYTVGVMLIPMSWQLEQALEVGRFVDHNSQEQPGIFGGDPRQHWYRGSIGDMEVFRSTSVPVDRIFLIDLRRWGLLRQWVIGDGEEQLLVEVIGFDPESAEELLLSQPDLLFELGEDSVRINALLERVRIRIRERFRIEVQDPAAARFLPLPTDLRGSS